MPRFWVISFDEYAFASVAVIYSSKHVEPHWLECLQESSVTAVVLPFA
jgi:hypothetical protein